MKIGYFWAHTFLKDRIRPDDVVFDIGMNYGGFTQVIGPLCQHVFGFEPNAFWNDQRPPLPPNVTVINKAVAVSRGILTFHLEPAGGPSSSLHLSASKAGASRVDVEAITLADAFASAEGRRIGFVKLDIEGEELPLLQAAPAEILVQIAQMTVEFEDYHSEQEIYQVIQKMRALGFFVVKFSWRNYGDVLFLNSRIEHISWYDRVLLILVHKYLRGVLRVVRRKVFKPAAQ